MKKVICQGCSEEHFKADMILVCIFCIQKKFIPKGDWLLSAFIDRKSYEQWWNHTKKFHTRLLMKIIKRQQQEKRMKLKWLE